MISYSEPTPQTITFEPENLSSLITHVEDGIMGILRTHGVVFYKKRELEVPQVPDSTIYDLFNGHIEESKFYISVLSNFVSEGIAMGDKYRNHANRQEWRRSMDQHYGDSFRRHYMMQNQLRVHSLYHVLFVLGTFPEAISLNKGYKDVLNAYFFQIKDHLAFLLDEKRVGYDNYAHMTNREKLVVIRRFEEGSVIALSILQRPYILFDQKWNRAFNKWIQGDSRTSNRRHVLYRRKD